MKSTKRKILRYLGIFLIIAGIALLIYPLYTNLIMNRQELEVLAAWDKQVADITAETTSGAITTETFGQLEKENAPVDPTKKIPFKIIIPKIDVEWVVNEGTDTATLKRGPGHYTGTALPGEVGACVIAGHRTTYGKPFNRVDELVDGDEILLETIGNELFIYTVTGNVEVPPTDMSVLKPTDYPSLVLSTCTPKFFATRRLIIYAKIAE